CRAIPRTARRLSRQCRRIAPTRITRECCSTCARCSPPDTHQSGGGFSVHPIPRMRQTPDTLCMSWITESFRRWARRDEPAPPAPKSLVFALCEEYRQQDLWSAYHAFRLDPQARTWHRLRGWSVPWQGEQTVADLFERM